MLDPVLKIILMCKVQGCRLPKKEVKFHPTRKWRFDLAWEKEKIAIEYEGLFCKKSRHITPKGYSNDASKYNAGILLGWKIFRFTQIHLATGEAFNTIIEIKKMLS